MLDEEQEVHSYILRVHSFDNRHWAHGPNSVLAAGTVSPACTAGMRGVGALLGRQACLRFLEEVGSLSSVVRAMVL